MLYNSIADKKSYAYFEQFIYTIEGKFNVKALDKALNEVIKRYEILQIKKIIVRIIDKLNDKEKDIIKAYYFKEISIADYSRQNSLNYYTCVKRIRRTESKILKNLRLYSLCRE